MLAARSETEGEKQYINTTSLCIPLQFSSRKLKKEQIVGSCTSIPTHYLYARVRKQQPGVITNSQKEAQIDSEFEWGGNPPTRQRCATLLKSRSVVVGQIGWTKSLPVGPRAQGTSGLGGEVWRRRRGLSRAGAQEHFILVLSSHSPRRRRRMRRYPTDSAYCAKILTSYLAQRRLQGHFCGGTFRRTSSFPTFFTDKRTDTAVGLW